MGWFGLALWFGMYSTVLEEAEQHQEPFENFSRKCWLVGRLARWKAEITWNAQPMPKGGSTIDYLVHIGVLPLHRINFFGLQKLDEVGEPKHSKHLKNEGALNEKYGWIKGLNWGCKWNSSIVRATVFQTVQTLRCTNCAFSGKSQRCIFHC